MEVCFDCPICKISKTIKTGNQQKGNYIDLMLASCPKCKKLVTRLCLLCFMEKKVGLELKRRLDVQGKVCNLYRIKAKLWGPKFKYLENKTNDYCLFSCIYEYICSFFFVVVFFSFFFQINGFGFVDQTDFNQLNSLMEKVSH